MNYGRPRVLIITGVFPPARIAEADHVLHMCHKLAERDFVMDVLATNGCVEDIGPSIRVHPVMSKWNWYELFRLILVARQCAPDLVYLWFVGHAYDFHPMITFVPAILKRVLPKVGVVTQIPGPVGSSAKAHSVATRLIRKISAIALGSTTIDYSYGTLFRDSDVVIPMAMTHLKVFSQIMPGLAAKSIVIPPPPMLPVSLPGEVSRKRGRQALGVIDGEAVFAYFGRLYRGKGVETLLKAFAMLCARQTHVKLAVIGGADENWHRDDWRVEQLYELARMLAIEDKVIWTGEYRWDSDAGSIYLRGADVAVLPFDMGMDLNHSSFAAVATHGLPTITTRGAVLEGPFSNGENLLLCPPLEPAALADAMEQVLLDNALRMRLSEGIKVLAKDWYSWDVSINKTISAFDAARAHRTL